MNTIVIAPTLKGYQLACQLQSILNSPEIWTKTPPPHAPANVKQITSIAKILSDCWSSCDHILFVLTVGAVVRLIGPFLQDKATDPGIVTLDETGCFVVSLCGGHQGGADQLARQLAVSLNATPVITSASTLQGYPALDRLGDPYGWQRGPSQTLEVMAALTQGHPIAVVQTCGTDVWQGLISKPTLNLESQPTPGTPYLWISDQVPPLPTTPKICWHPRTLWIGIGCERGTPAAFMDQAIRQVLTQAQLAFESIAGLASIDLKQDEDALQDLHQRYQWPLLFFKSTDLAQQVVPNPSEQVARAVGTPSVAEAAALRAAQTDTLLVSKQIFQFEIGACTLAIARTLQAYTPHSGQINLIGTGPGDLAQMTVAAREAIVRSDVVIGYLLYMDLIRPLLHPDQVIETSLITQEVQRADRAITLAQQGLKVAVISSGDSGIYGMAGIVLERLTQQAEWQGENPNIEVFPGITALQAVAARVGSPLMHDFCAISLSDLLTPWPVIEQRLIAAASADFVVGLYNPRSQQRTEGMVKAKQIFLHHRSPQTPVVVAQSVYRPQEVIYHTTLAALDVTELTMLTLILIGNASSFLHNQFLITPRGYFNR